MKLHRILLTALATFGFFSVNAADDGCNQSTREPNASVKKYNLQSHKNYQFDIWRLDCDSSMQIIVKIYPKNGKTRAVTNWIYDAMYLYQDGKRVSSWDMWDGERLVTNEDPIFVANVWEYDSPSYDFEMKRTFEVKIDKAGSVLLSGNTKASGQTSGMSGVTGTWYDPAYTGSGFNVVEAMNGLFVYFYGYKAGGDGQAQWLVSEVGPKSVVKGQAITLKVYAAKEGNGANFMTKPASGSGVSEWGKLTLTFNSCSAGTMVLNGNDGQITHNVVKLANVKNLKCSE